MAEADLRSISTFGHWTDDFNGDSSVATDDSVYTFGWFIVPAVWTEETKTSRTWTEQDRNIIPPTIYFGHASAFFGNFFFGQALRTFGEEGWAEETQPTTVWVEEIR